MNSAKIRVAVRVRPLLENEIKAGSINSRIDAQEGAGEVKVVVDENKQLSKSYKFDHVFSEQSTQAQFYEQCEIDHLLNQIIDGYHATIFAYGQTGSGKTFTMEGIDKDNKQDPQTGLIPRAIRTLFQKIQKHSTQRQFTIYVSYLQIYNERIFDLLGGVGKINSGPSGAGLKLRWNAREQFTVENLFIYQCKTAEEVLELFYLGLKNRVTASHKLNLTSSRSHSILEIKIESIDNQNADNFLSSKLELVDLAGSERISLTGAEGKQAKESIDINKSLFILRQVINAVSDQIQNKGQNVHIPYRDSKLTCLLKQSIGGNSFCLMIACLVPGDAFFDENISTLQYASKATIITNLPQKNDDPKNKQILDLKSQILVLRAELDKANKHISFLTLIVQNGEQSKTPQPPEVKPSIKEIPQIQNNEKTNDEFDAQVDKYQTLTQFFQPQVKQKTEEPLDYDIFSDRLVDSINMVRELLLSNKEMREKEESTNTQIDTLQREMTIMQRENFELREKLLQQPAQELNEQENQNQDEKQQQYFGSSTQKAVPFRPSPKKAQNNQQSFQRKGNNQSMIEDVGFLPEQSTQFQRQVQNAQFTNEVRDVNNSQSGKRTQIPVKIYNQSQGVRNQSLPNRGAILGANILKPQLPHIKQIQYQAQQSAAQQFFNDEDQQANGDELTNFGRRTLYQNGYNQSQQKINDDTKLRKLPAQTFSQFR